MFNNSKVICSIIAIICFMIAGTINNKGMERFTVHDRSVTLLDVGVTVESIKTNKISSVSGIFLDDESGLAFTAPVNLTTYAQFKSGGHNEIKMTLPFNKDTVNGNSVGIVFVFLSVLITVVGIIFIVLVTQFLQEDWARRKRKALNNSSPSAT